VFAWKVPGLVFLDSRTGRVLPNSSRWVDLDEGCNGMGWSPDGRWLVVGGPNSGSWLLDERGRKLQQIPGRSAVNSGMSWAPDGRSILMYDWKAQRNVIRDMINGTQRTLEQPVDALRPMGWAGSRVVWLAGQPGDQRLVTTDQAGGDERPWMRLDVGDRAVQAVEWTTDLSGRPAHGGP
jgi:Tol biopolymer transport system component